MGTDFQHNLQIAAMVVAAVGVPLLGRAVWLAVMPAPGVREAMCARCRYPVSGLGGMICPECGVDLRQAGIVTPALAARWRGSTVAGVTAWVTLWAGLAVLMYPVFRPLLRPQDLRMTTSQTEWAVAWSALGSVLYLSTMVIGLIAIVRRRKQLLGTGVEPRAEPVFAENSTRDG